MNEEWNKIHAYAASVNTYSGAVQFDSWIRDYAQTLSCNICKQHMLDYLEQVPPMTMHPFVWTWVFHNSVNLRLEKPFYCYKCAREKYFGSA